MSHEKVMETNFQPKQGLMSLLLVLKFQLLSWLFASVWSMSSYSLHVPLRSSGARDQERVLGRRKQDDQATCHVSA